MLAMVVEDAGSFTEAPNTVAVVQGAAASTCDTTYFHADVVPRHGRGWAPESHT